MNDGIAAAVCYAATLNFTLIDLPNKLLVPDLQLHPFGYLRALINGLVQVLGDVRSEYGGGLIVLWTVALAAAASIERRSADPRGLMLAGARNRYIILPSTGTSSSATMLMILINGLIAGPAVSL
jgi:hypothetical protein